MTSWCFGIVTDVQHKSKADDAAYVTTLDRLERAVADWNEHEPSVSFIVNAGDTIDGGDTVADSTADMANVLDRFAKATSPVYHVLGNHCHKNNPAAREQLGLPECGYRSRVVNGWTFVFLDTTELSLLLEYPEGHPVKAEVEAYLKAHPLNSRPEMLDYNGGVTRTQLAWLEGTLAAADCGRRVIVFCHHPLYPCAGLEAMTAWNAGEIRGVLDKHRGKVHSVFSGHHHPGAYHFAGGVHYVVAKAMLSFPEESAYSIAHLDNDAGTLRLDGRGTAQADMLLKSGVAFSE
ncbi:Manganese-dependent ADP-ribose/CDP-alcohol diphosphatase [Diplonema papillatum]|nr:Manganese-dependent ADP-ribose/CDP-alcohol diphosphatase [Diplonema papillatum]